MSYNRDEGMKLVGIVDAARNAKSASDAEPQDIELCIIRNGLWSSAEARVFDLGTQLAAAVAEIDRLREVCGETYQAFGAICGDSEQCVRVLDNLSDAAAGDPPRHRTVLPFLDEPAARSRYVGGRDVAETQRFGGRQTMRPSRIDLIGQNGNDGLHYPGVQEGGD